MAQAADLLGVDRDALPVGMLGEEAGDLALALGDLQRAGAVDEEAAGGDPAGGAGDEAMLQLRQFLDLRRLLEAADVGVAAQRAGGRAGGVEEDGVEGRLRRPGLEVGDEGLDLGQA